MEPLRTATLPTLEQLRPPHFHSYICMCRMLYRTRSHCSHPQIFLVELLLISKPVLCCPRQIDNFPPPLVSVRGPARLLAHGVALSAPHQPSCCAHHAAPLFSCGQQRLSDWLTDQCDHSAASQSQLWRQGVPPTHLRTWQTLNCRRRCRVGDKRQDDDGRSPTAGVSLPLLSPTVPTTRRVLAAARVQG